MQPAAEADLAEKLKGDTSGKLEKKENSVWKAIVRKVEARVGVRNTFTSGIGVWGIKLGIRT